MTHLIYVNGAPNLRSKGCRVLCAKVVGATSSEGFLVLRMSGGPKDVVMVYISMGGPHNVSAVEAAYLVTCVRAAVRETASRTPCV